MSNGADEDLRNAFIRLFIRFGMDKEKAKKTLEGVSGADLRNSPEIKRIINEDVERTRKKQEEERAKAEKERAEKEKERLALKKLEALKPQIETAEAQFKKLSEERDQILKSLT